MKIGLVLSRTPEYSETFFVSKIDGLLASGFDVTLFVQNNDSNFSICKVILAPSVNKQHMISQFFKVCYILIELFIRYTKPFFKFIGLELKANKSWLQIVKNVYNNSHILKANLDWLHFGFATIAIQSEHIAKAIDAKMAVSFRGFDLDVYPLQHPNCYELLWGNVDKAHPISNYMLDKAYNLGLSRKVPYKIITPAIDMSKFKGIVYEIPQNICFLTIARLHKIKGLNDTLEAMALLKEKGIDFKYSIIGDGIECDNLKTLINKLKLSNYVNLEGKKDHNKVIEYLNETSIYIQYSESEGFCNAVLEAQAVGLLCVVSNGGALPENVLHKKTGWVVPKRNPKALAKTIEEVINLPEDVKSQIRINAQHRVTHEFNLEKQQKEFIEFYKE